MTAGIWFWILYVVSLVFTGWWWWPPGADRAPWLIVYVLIGLLGWGVFGAPIR